MPCNRSRNLFILKNSGEKNGINVESTKVTMHATKYKILGILWIDTPATKVLLRAERESYFLEIVKSCSGHSKAYKSVKNQKLKACKKPILSSIYTVESKK